MENFRRIMKALVALGSVAAGFAAMVWLIHTKPTPPHSPASRIPDVAVMETRPQIAQEAVVGFGTVRPKEQISIVPQVSGKLVFAHEDLAQGKIIPEGDVLFEIDRTVYDSRVRQVEAEIRGFEAGLQLRDQEMVNLGRRIANVERMLAIDEQDYLTSKRLYEVDKVGTQRDVDLVYQKYLSRKDVLVELASRRATVPHLKDETQARLDASRASLQAAKYDLANTSIICPFEARVETVGARASQVVTAHLSIATITNMEAFEISVGIDPRDLHWLDDAIQPDALESNDGTATPEVAVTWSMPARELTWRGRVTRLERVDEATRTARMVVEIRGADMEARTATGDAAGPGLSIGMHCRADLPARPLEGAILVPRHAIYDHRWVYVFEPGSPGSNVGRLGVREIPMLRAMGDDVLVDYSGRRGAEVCELQLGERVVVSPLTKPVVGMEVMQREPGLASLPVFPITPPAPKQHWRDVQAPPVTLGQISLLGAGQ